MSNCVQVRQSCSEALHGACPRGSNDWQLPCTKVLFSALPELSGERVRFQSQSLLPEPQSAPVYRRPPMESSKNAVRSEQPALVTPALTAGAREENGVSNVG